MHRFTNVHAAFNDHRWDIRLLHIAHKVAGAIDETATEKVERGVAEHAEATFGSERFEQLGSSSILCTSDRLYTSRTIDMGDRIQFATADLLEVQHMRARSGPL